MIKRNYKTKMVETDIVESTEIICDRCDTVIAHYTEDGSVYKSHFDDYFVITLGHHDWGNDSIESIEEHDFCPKCIDKVFEEYKKLCLGRYNTRYIEFEHVHTLPNKGEEK